MKGLIVKITKIALLLILLIPSTINAQTIDVGGSTGGPGTSGGPSGTGNGNGGTCESATVAKTESGCGISISTSYRSIVELNVYDENGELIGDVLSQGFKTKKFTAGRFAGIDFYEEYRKTVTASINPYCISVTLECTHKETNKDCNPILYCDGIMVNIRGEQKCAGKWKTDPNCTDVEEKTSYTVTEGSCDDGDSGVGSCSLCTPPSVSSCRGEAEASINTNMEKKSPSYNAAMQGHGNDIKDEIKQSVQSYDEYYEGEIEPADVNASVISKTSYQRIKYNPQKTCINVKTGNVNYIKFDENCNENNEITVKNFTNAEGERIGMYFIPLNTKSVSTYRYFMDSNNSGKQSPELCENFLNKYGADGRWRILLKDQDGQPFPTNISVETAREYVKNGCYYAVTVNFNINQEFYNENNSNMIEGYGVYFRPIDINNPFPNGLSSNSLWNGFYNATSKKVENVKDAIGNNIDLKKSFNSNELNYKIYLTNKKIKNIKKFNASEEESKGIYTSWEAMRKNGTSSFITTGRFDILNRITKNNKYNFYKLGCGPLNANWEECK